MASGRSPERSGDSRPALRLWPGVVAVVLLFLVRFGVKRVVPGFTGFQYSMLGGLACVLLVLLWWLFLSRAPWLERFGGLVLLVGALAGAWYLKHDSMGPLWLLGYALPWACLAFVVGAGAGRGLGKWQRRVLMDVVVVLACFAWLLFRTEGIDGDHDASFAWRWSKTAEERLLDAADRPVGTSDVVVADAVPAVDVVGAASAAWPGFRGPRRDGHAATTGPIAPDWQSTPPRELWRRPVGPGWSSFAVDLGSGADGGRLYTQEQRGDDEAVSCYDLATGEPLWLHTDPVRFFESNAGAGPRGTPTLARGRVHALGATGILNALDAADGSPVWSRDAAGDVGAALPDWGFSSSPLVLGDSVYVALSGVLAAYDAADGTLRWFSEDGGVSYASPHLASFGGVPQVLLASGSGLTSFSPASGATLWRHPWPGFPMMQPALLGSDETGGELLLSVTQSSGVRRLAVTHASDPDGDNWNVAERWTSLRLKPYFNDFVVHRGHAYGFDGRILAAIDLETGERAWKGGRYGNGQLLLLPAQDLLLVLAEDGDVALVAADPERHHELSRISALHGKTWNHPVVAGGLLLVRNGEEMVAFRLP